MTQVYRCVLVEDEPLAQGLMQKHIAQFEQLELVATCWNAMEALPVLQQQPIDLLFLDIQLPGLSGMDFLRTLSHPPRVIFTTAYREYAAESYELEVVDYLVKPITFDRFFKAISRFLQEEAPATPPPHVSATAYPAATTETEDSMYMNTQRKYQRIRFREVLFVESLKDYVRIHLEDQQVMTKDKISEFADKLPDYFIRVHRSYVVNTQQITGFTAQDIEIGPHEIPIGISYKQAVMDALKRG
ncbi:MAG TPA: DNA-binding response regulator [Cytophagales bacterium]|nr:DNA-binding response regulator [Cytophagales bacterium]